MTLQLHNSPDRYGAVAQGFHWLTVLLVGSAWLLGQGMAILPRGDARAAGIAVHIAIGLAVLAVVAARFVWRVADRQPVPAKSPLGRWNEIMAEVAHYALYALVAAAPIAGIAYWFALGRDLPVFGLFHVTSPWVASRTLAGSMREIHETLANAIMLLAGFHAVAALVHHYVFRDRTLERMLPHRG